MHTSIPLPKDGRFVVAGDWHANYLQAQAVIRHALEAGIDTIIHVGDFGFYEHVHGFLKQTNNALKRANIMLYAIDGNHEEFPYLYSKPLDLTTQLRPVRSNIIHLPRNTRWEWDGISFLALGGAASIDFASRKTGVSWWPEEALTKDDVQTAIDGGHANVMFTHDCPVTLPNPITADPLNRMQALKFFGQPGLDYSNLHQQVLTEVTNAVKPELLYHGHFHAAHRRHYRHSDGTYAFGIGLNQGGSPSNWETTSTGDIQVILDNVRAINEGNNTPT